MTLWTQQVKCIQVALSMCIALGFSPTPEVVLSQLGVDQGYNIVQMEYYTSASLLPFRAA